MVSRQVLWVDDEIELLEAHLLFLRGRGYEVTGAHSGEDAIEWIQKRRFDLVLLDEQMPGMDGLTTLEKLKKLDPNLPVVMVTKTEEDRIMDQAIGKKIDDYLTKPVNPSQILSVIKRLLEKRKIQSEHLAKKYVEDFNSLRDILSGALEVHLFSISNQLNVTMKRLTAWGTIFVIITAIAGIYGMNFEHMPELTWRYGYLAIMTLMGAISLGLYFYFKRKDYL